MAQLKGTLSARGRLVGSIAKSSGGTWNYPDLENLPQINGVTLIDNKTSEELGINIPTKTSDLENNSGFITSDVLPTKTSDLRNDSGYVTMLDVILGIIDDAQSDNDSTYSSNKIEAIIDALLPIDKASGAIATFNTTLAKPLVSIDVDESATKVFQLGSNFFDKSTITSGKLINGAGNEVSYSGWNVSDFIPVVSGASYYLYGLSAHPNTQQDNFELFDASKEKTGFANVKTYNQPYTIPSGVKYVKFSLADADLSTAQFGVSQNSIYEPYNPVINEYDVGETITTLIGKNNIFADSGNIDIAFKDSIQHYIDKKIAETQALIL